MWEKLLRWLAERMMPLRHKLDRMHWPGFVALGSNWRQTREKVLAKVKLPDQAHAATWLRSKQGRNIVISTLALTVSAVVLIVRFWPPPAAPRTVWYMDLGTGELFVADSGLTPPIAAPSGTLSEQGQPMGVRAHVFARGSCWWPWSRYVGYLENAAPQTSAKFNRPAFAPAVTEDDLQVSRPDVAGGWISMNSKEGMDIIRAAMEPDGRAAHECFP